MCTEGHLGPGTRNGPGDCPASGILGDVWNAGGKGEWRGGGLEEGTEGIGGGGRWYGLVRGVKR